MPVDFTKKNNKPNTEYLRELINAGITEANMSEALEFLEAIENEQLDAKEKIPDLEDKVEDADEEEPEYDNELDFGNGLKDSLKWSCGNLPVQSLMERLETKLSYLSPYQIEEHLAGLKTPEDIRS